MVGAARKGSGVCVWGAVAEGPLFAVNRGFGTPTGRTRSELLSLFTRAHRSEPHAGVSDDPVAELDVGREELGCQG